MGRAIDQDNRLDDHERRIKLMEDALEEMIQTKVHHVDLTDLKTKDDKLSNHETKVREENTDEEFTPPAGRRKVTRKKTATVD